MSKDIVRIAPVSFLLLVTTLLGSVAIAESDPTAALLPLLLSSAGGSGSQPQQPAGGISPALTALLGTSGGGNTSQAITAALLGSGASGSSGSSPSADPSQGTGGIAAALLGSTAAAGSQGQPADPNKIVEAALLSEATTLKLVLEVNGSPSPMYSLADHPVLVSWAAKGANSCTLSKGGQALVKGAIGGVNEVYSGSPLDTFSLACTNIMGQSETKTISVGWLFYGVGGPKKASYLFTSIHEAAECKDQIASAKDKNCRKMVKIGTIPATAGSPSADAKCECNSGGGEGGGGDYAWVTASGAGAGAAAAPAVAGR